MKLTKYLHSCLLVEDANVTTLFDPGEFSWNSGIFKLEESPQIDQIAITHEHFDHCHLPFIEAIVSKFPDVVIISNRSVIEKLNHLNCAKQTASTPSLEVVDVAHESMSPLMPHPVCDHAGFHLSDRLSHTGDSLKFTETKPILCLPLAGPWESAVQAIQFGLDLNPQHIVPIHDWMWSQQWRDSMYERLAGFFQGHGITFHKPVDGKAFTVG